METGNAEPATAASLSSHAPASGCCVGATGNIDNDINDVTDIADLTFLIDHLFITLTPLSCPAEANIDGDGAGVVDIADLTFLIDHLFISLLPTAACQISYAADVQPILSSRCAIPACHGSGFLSGGFSMEDGAPYNIVRNAVGIHGPIIVAGNAAASNLYLKTTATPPFLSRMPLVGGFLSDAEQALIRDWINQGAANN